MGSWLDGVRETRYACVREGDVVSDDGGTFSGAMSIRTLGRHWEGESKAPSVCLVVELDIRMHCRYWNAREGPSDRQSEGAECVNVMTPGQRRSYCYW